MVCDSDQTDYTVSGCSEIECTQPSDITGYTVVETELSVAIGFDVTPSCAAGYEGAPAVAECTSSGDYTLSGCVDDDECIDGTHTCDANGACTNTEGSFTCECNAGYTGDGQAGNCHADGTHTCDAPHSSSPPPPLVAAHFLTILRLGPQPAPPRALATTHASCSALRLAATRGSTFSATLAPARTVQQDSCA